MTGPKAEIYVATESGSAEVKGETFIFQKGVTRVRAGHPLLKAVPDYFEPMETHVTYEHGKAKVTTPPEVEQATAAPGEKRGEA